MKKIIAILMLCSALSTEAQTGKMYVAVGYKNLVDKPYEKIIGKEWVDFKDGTEPGMYYIVEYNYGEPPPSYMEIVKSYLTHGFPDTIRGWIVTDTLLYELGGDCLMMCVDVIKTCTNKINSLLPVYIERMAINIPGCGGSKEEFSIRIWTTDEEMKRRTAEIDKK